MERAPVLYLLLTLLAFYFLAPCNAIPLSRVQRLPLEVAGETPLVKGSSTLEPKTEVEMLLPDDGPVITARMAFETQDYAPSGPNNHHKPPGWS
ncbi:hypothetical protein ACP70R_006825 [Stipagrostis hirtigluma subsp. patula]